MTFHIRRLSLLAGTAVAASAAFAAAVTAFPSSPPELSPVAAANTRSDGYAPVSVLSPRAAAGRRRAGLQSPRHTSALTSYYGYDNDVVNAAGQPQMLPSPTTATEAHKTEPDKNTYLVFRTGLPGADRGYDYGTHFLFQGHEGGAGARGTSRASTSTPTARIASRCWPPRTTRATRSPRSTARPGTRGRAACC